MKLSKFANVLVFGIVLAVAASGCKKTPVGFTKIPGPSAGVGPGSGGPEPAGALTGETPPVTEHPFTGIPAVGPEAYSNYVAHPEILKEETIYFDFDSSAIKTSEKSKLATVADYLKNHPAEAVRVEGNCDERGTEEYNRSLGERRATAAREALVQLGADSQHILTVSYGKDKPAAPGHNEAAWRLNRRDDFVVLQPPAPPAP
jgi:peptidoglycan-associated lipoprotein